MPLPLIPVVVFAAKFLIGKAAVAKTVAVTVKGATVLTKAAAGHGAVVAKTAATASHLYGATAVVSTAAVLAISVGSAAIIFEKGQKLKQAVENGNVSDALVAAPSFLTELNGLGGLDDVRSTLSSFISSGGATHFREVAEQVLGLLGALENRIKSV